MAFQIHVQYTAEDGRAHVKKEYIKGLGVKSVKSVSIVDIYTVDVNVATKDKEKIAQALHVPLSQNYSINTALAPKVFSHAIEIGFLPGVTDNIGNTARETVQDILGRKLNDDEKVYSSQIIFLDGKLSIENVKTIAGGLHNPLIQRGSIKTFIQFKEGKGMDMVLPKVKLTPGTVDEVDLLVSDEELIKIGKSGIMDVDGTRRGPLGLGLDELKVIRSHFHRLKRNPTDIELETLAQTWSEHCKHTIFANPLGDVKEGIYKKYIQGATKKIRKDKGKDDFCVSVFTDNSGVIKFDKDTHITHKVETHNSPSALDPFGGAITGILGVNRDTLGTGLGAKPALNFYGYCFADPRDKTRLFRDKEKTQELLSARRIMEGVIAGVNAGGNQSGIPTPQGFTCFEKRFRGKPLVFVGTVGLLPKTTAGRKSHEKSAQNGDYVVMVGGRVGLDGVHGATFSSEALDSDSPATAVQIGDAITQKKLSDAIVKEARDMNLYSSITDNGAGGLSSSVGEMAEESGGCEIWLDKVPVKYPGLSPWQIWISESQERMTLSVPKKKWDAFKKLMDRRGVESTVVGMFNNSGSCTLKFGDKIISDLDMEFMHDGNPVALQQVEEYIPDFLSPSTSIQKKYQKNLGDTLNNMIARANIASNEFISSQYDHGVQGSSVTKPLQGMGRVNTTATVSKPKLDSKKGVVMSQGLCPTYSDIDTYHMAASAIDQAIRNVVATGGNPDYVAILDNFCWCSSNDPKRLYQLERAAKACYDYAVAYKAPFISGKDSMFNDFKGFTTGGKQVLISVPPTLLISSISVIPDARTVVTLDIKFVDDVLYLLGDTYDELGGSEYIAMMSDENKKDFLVETVPQVDAVKNMKMYRSYYKAIQKGLITSAIPLGRGGLGIALAKTAMAGKLGLDINLKKNGNNKLSDDVKLFSESNGRILVSVSPQKLKSFESIMKNSSLYKIGKVTCDAVITLRGDKVSEVKVSKALNNYRKTFKNY